LATFAPLISLMLPKVINEIMDKGGRDFGYEYVPIKLKANDLSSRSKELPWLNKPGLIVHDSIDSQLKELAKLRNPSKPLTESAINEFVNEMLGGVSMEEYGVWVYYPWRHTLTHLLDEEEFIEVRTVRNKVKITQKEQEELRNKTVGIIGLSVGQSVAVTIAMERIAGTIRIADFDYLELSNLNRIRTSVLNLGLPKCMLLAREISEIDPFINVEVFPAGITIANVQDFVCGGSKLDLMIEECDSVDVKVFSRNIARQNMVPVIMDTSDLLLLDVERFDEQHERPILHGLIQENLNDLNDFEKNKMVMKLIELDKVSDRGKESLFEIGKSITNWPQLATDVIAGGAHAAMIAREILLGKPVASGRTRLDFINFHNQNARFKP